MNKLLNDLVFMNKLLFQPANVYQNSEKWKDKLVGTGKKTIGAVGCALCAFTGLLSLLTKIAWTPDQINLLLTYNGAYDNDNELHWYNATKFLPIELKNVGNYKYKRADLNGIIFPFIALIDYSPLTTELDYHFILVTHKIENMYYAIDPLDGHMFELLTKYTNKDQDWDAERLILKTITYRGQK